LAVYYAAHSSATAPMRTSLANHEERLRALTQPHSTMVMEESDAPRPTHILHRGSYMQPGELVSCNTPAVLPAAAGAPSNRLGLARWAVMPENPLTARVAVNRIWRLFFGVGIVATPADFGVTGEYPSHPELLDWLAVDFRSHDWDVKRLVRQLVTSSTYRQTARETPELLERDPANRLLARGPRFRLQAELIRDAALKVSGLLVDWHGGPSVNPYAPGDLWREVSHYGSTPATAQTFVQDHGEKLYRRSIYTYWKRTAPPPNLAAFDAPSRETCVVDRGRTNTPMQALVTLNDVQFVEASRAFAQRVLTEPGSDKDRLRRAVTECLSREPSDAELRVLTHALERERTRYVADLQAAESLLRVGEAPRNTDLAAPEHAAWTQIASLLLNLSETVTRN
ncbi:MAG: DUF1553 domain-containing protein, partial [Planctomycetales bacterium]|nr:DUF1553 domain-containing protein [Planctomycetales bacterium]